MACFLSFSGLPLACVEVVSIRQADDSRAHDSDAQDKNSNYVS